MLKNNFEKCLLEIAQNNKHRITNSSFKGKKARLLFYIYAREKKP